MVLFKNSFMPSGPGGNSGVVVGCDGAENKKKLFNYGNYLILIDFHSSTKCKIIALGLFTSFPISKSSAGEVVISSFVGVVATGGITTAFLLTITLFPRHPCFDKHSLRRDINSLGPSVHSVHGPHASVSSST